MHTVGIRPRHTVAHPWLSGSLHRFFTSSSCFIPSSAQSATATTKHQPHESPPRIAALSFPRSLAPVTTTIRSLSPRSSPTVSLWCSRLSDSRLAHLPARSSLPSSLTVAAAGHQHVVVQCCQQRSSISASDFRMASASEKYAAFEEKVSRTVYFDNLSPQCALIELDSSKKVKEVVSMISQYPFMMSGMPRPVRARPAEAEMFDDRPEKPDRKIKCCWLDPSDPDFEVAKDLKRLTRRHAVEAEYVHKLQLQEEKKLAEQQGETLNMHYKKFKLVDSIMADGTAKHLAKRYNLGVADE
ncbi:hypothetical protein AAHE18_14G098600 [Arachis hypogaea]